MSFIGGGGTSGAGGASGDLYNMVSVFRFSGTWTCPPGVSEAMVLVWGAGGGGGSVRNVSGNSTGGGGGGFAQALCTVAAGTSYSVTIGAGGGPGAAGGTSSFSTLVSATGGAGGTATTSWVAGGSGTTSGVLWQAKLANGGGTNAASYSSIQNPQGTGGGGSGSPYGDGGVTCIANYFDTFPGNKGTGGGGWGGSSIGQSKSGLQWPGRFFSITSPSNPSGTGGGGLFNAGINPGSGGGGSHADAPLSLNGYYNTATSAGIVAPLVAGGGQARASTLYYNATASQAISSFLGVTTTANISNSNWFDILNMNLQGVGGEGIFAGTAGQFFNLQAGNAIGSGAGGGGVCHNVNDSLLMFAGAGSIGGGGGGMFSIGTGTDCYAGQGGFGGGGGGCIMGGVSRSAGAGDSLMGGGGGGALNVSGGDPMPGVGGNGCVLIFYKLT